MTYEEACKLLGWTEPPPLGKNAQRLITKGAIRLSENGTKPIDPRVAHLYRAQAEEFA